jgi:hypothetical protein
MLTLARELANQSRLVSASRHKFIKEEYYHKLGQILHNASACIFSVLSTNSQNCLGQLTERSHLPDLFPTSMHHQVRKIRPQGDGAFHLLKSVFVKNKVDEVSSTWKNQIMPNLMRQAYGVLSFLLQVDIDDMMMSNCNPKAVHDLNLICEILCHGILLVTRGAIQNIILEQGYMPIDIVTCIITY